MFFNDFLHTGRRCFDGASILTIDLWRTDQQAELTLCDGQGKILLDEDESRLLRSWAERSTEAAGLASQVDLLEMRLRFQQDLLDAAKLNRAASRAASRARKQPAKVASAANVVDLNVWKAAQREIEPSLALAA